MNEYVLLIPSNNFDVYKHFGGIEILLSAISCIIKQSSEGFKQKGR